MRRLLIPVLPALAVAVVGWATLTTLRPAPVLAARVHGGPCATGSPRSLLILLSAARGDEREPAPQTMLRARVTESSGESSSWQGTTDEEGLVELALGHCATGAALLELEGEQGERFARGELAPELEPWRGADRQGGWLTGQASGELRLRLAPLEGALAVPFASALVVVVEGRDGGPARRVQLLLSADGAALEPAAAVSDERGRARVRIEPLEHAISLGVEARSAGGAEGRWYGALPVVPGALHVALDGRRLRVRSPIARERAYLSLVNERARLAGAVVELEPDASGGATGSVELMALSGAAQGPLWAVVSSEPDKRSAALVGWPLHDLDPSLRDLDAPPRGDGWPPRTFDARDQLLLDGLPEARAGERAARLSRRRGAALGAAALGLLAGVLLALEVRSAARRAPKLEGSRPRRGGAALGVALTCLTLGLAALVWFGTLGAP